MKKTILFLTAFIPASGFTQTKTFTEKLEGITASKKELTKNAATDNSSIGQSGVMSTSVPLVTVSSRTMTFPLELSYTSGIKVDQQSGPVGLGWVLPVGSIKRDYGAFFPDYSSTYHEADMYNTVNENGGQTLKGKFATMNGSIVNPFANHQYLGFDAIENDASRAAPLSDLYHVSVPGKLSNSFYNSGLISTPANPDKPHLWTLTEMENWKVEHTVKTYQISQEFSRINEINLTRPNGNIDLASSYAAAIGVLPYVKNGFAKVASTNTSFTPTESESYVRYEDFEKFIITDDNGTVYVFGRALRGQRYVFSDDPFWSNKYEQSTDDPAKGNFWKIDYIAEWLLTEIHSADYYDSNGNFMADDGDEGDWIRFEYTDPKKTEPAYLGGSCFWYEQSVPKHREWSSFSQTDRASSLMRELAYLQKIVTPTQQIDFTISERYDVNHDYFTKPANRVGNDYYYEDLKLCTTSSTSDFDITYPVETMKYDQIQIKSRLVNGELYPDEHLSVGTIKFNYAAKGSAQELAVSSYLIRNNDKQEKIAPNGKLIGSPTYSSFNMEDYANNTDKRGKTTLLGLEFYGSIVSAAEKNEYKFEYGYNPSFDEFHKREIIRAYYFPSVRQGSSPINQPNAFSKADTPMQYNYPQVTYNSSGLMGGSTHADVSPYDFLINFPIQENLYTLNTSPTNKTTFANIGAIQPGSYTLLSTPITNAILPIQDVYGYFYIPGYAPAASAWSLTKITYPTGGEVAFEYEPASFTPSNANSEWNLYQENFPVISQYNAVAKNRSFVQDAHNVANSDLYTSLGLSTKKLTATYEVPMYTSYGIRLKKKTSNDKINPLVATNYEYGTGTFTAMPAEYVQSLISGFNQFITRENHRHQLENFHYYNSSYTYDYQERMSHISQTNIALDDYSATGFYNTIKIIQADNSYIKKTYGPSYGTGIDFPNYSLFCYRTNSVAWQAGLLLGGDNVNRVPISLKSEEYFETGASTPYQKVEYEYTELDSHTQNINFKYNLSPTSNNTVALWNLDFEVFKPDGTNGFVTYKPVNGLVMHDSYVIGINSPSVHSYTKWGQSKTVMSKEITQYKGIVSTTEYTYDELDVSTAVYGYQHGAFVLRETKKTTLNEPLVYYSRNEYAIENYGPWTPKFKELNLISLPYKTTTYLNGVANTNTLHTQVITYDYTPRVPKALDSYVYETPAVDPATGTFSPTPFSTTDPNWRIAQAAVYERNPAAMPVSTRSNQVYTKTVTGNGLTTVKATISGTELPFDATYTGFEDFKSAYFPEDWNEWSYLKEDWFSTDNSNREITTKVGLTDIVPPCSSNYSNPPVYFTITADDITELLPGKQVTFSYTTGGNTYTYPVTIANTYPTSAYPQILVQNPNLLDYFVCFQTAPSFGNFDPDFIVSKIVIRKPGYKVNSSYAHTGKYSYQLSSIRTNGSATKKTPVRPVRIAPMNIPTECQSTVPENPGEGGYQYRNLSLPAGCYWDYSASLWIKYDTDIPPLTPPTVPSTPSSDDAAGDAIYRRGTVNTTTDPGIRIICKIWNSSKTTVLDQYTFYPQELSTAWKQYTVDFSIFKGPEQWVEVYVENTVNQVGAPIMQYKSAFVDDIIVAPKAAKYAYSVTDARGNQTFQVNNNDVFVQTTYDAKGRVASARNAYGRVQQELTYFDQANWTSSHNYVTEVKWVSNGLFNTTRYFMDGFARTKQVQSSDHVRNMRAVSETNIYNNKGQIIRSYKPYYLSQYGLDPKYDPSYAAKTQTLYGSSNAFTEVTFEPKPEDRVASVKAPRADAESPIVSTQTEYMNTAVLSHVSADGTNNFPAGTLLVNQTVNPVGKITRTYLNRLGQVIMEEHQIGMNHVQNTDGSITFTTADQGFAQTWFYYDGAGRIVKTYDPENKKTSYFYNSLGVLVKVISPDKGTSELRYDKYGQVRFTRNQKDIDLTSNNSFGTSQFKYTKYDKWGQALESGVVTVAPNTLNVSTTNPPFPTGDFFNDYAKINDQNYPLATTKFVQIHTQSIFDGTRKFYSSTVPTSQRTYSQHVLNTTTYLYAPGKTDYITVSYMADGQNAKTGYSYDGLAGTHVIKPVYNDMNLPVGKEYTNSVNAAFNFQWKTAIDIYGRAVTHINTYNGVNNQVSKNYYDPLGNLLLVGLGTTGNTGDPHRDYVSIKKNIREQLISQMSKNFRVGLTYDAAGNITNQYWSNEAFEPASAGSTKINQYAYTYDKMNRLVGADYKQSIMTSNPFAYYASLNATIPGDFVCTLDGEVVSLAFRPYYTEFENNLANRIDVDRSRNSVNALNLLQSDYMRNNVQYTDMSTVQIDDFFTGYISNCNRNRLIPTDFEYYQAEKANDQVHINYLKSNPVNPKSFKYMKILLGSMPWTPPVNCMPNPNATAYGYLQNFPAPVATENVKYFDEAFWYQKNGNFTTLNRNNNTGQRTQQLYTYQSGTNRLTQASFQFTTGTPNVYTYPYDGNGNLTADAKNGISSMAYSFFDDLPVSMTNTSGQHGYRYFGGARSVKEISATDREYYVDQVILDQNGTVKSYQTASGYAIPNGSSAGYYYQVKDWLGSMRITLRQNGVVDNAVDYYSYGKVMPARNAYATNQEGYRYTFTGHEKDGETSYQYHGARYYDEDLGRYMSVDRYAMKFFHQSPYVYAGNMPINAIDNNGDSVLFYSESGDYLGYSHDNQRYKDKNLLSIIADKNVSNFREQYELKRSEQYRKDKKLTTSQVEGHVAGLEAMGTTYNVTQINGFIRDYTEMIGLDLDNAKKSPVTFDKSLGRLQKQQEWGAWMVNSENPVVKGKMNWVTIDESTITTDGAPGYVIMPSLPDNGKSWLHLHTSTSKKSIFSGNDSETMDTKNNNPNYKNITYWVGQIDFNQQYPGLEKNLNYYYHSENRGITISLDSKSFKNAK